MARDFEDRLRDARRVVETHGPGDVEDALQRLLVGPRRRMRFAVGRRRAGVIVGGVAVAALAAVFALLFVSSSTESKGDAAAGETPLPISALDGPSLPPGELPKIISAPTPPRCEVDTHRVHRLGVDTDAVLYVGRGPRDSIGVYLEGADLGRGRSSNASWRPVT